jgi:hypothetical protein
MDKQVNIVKPGRFKREVSVINYGYFRHRFDAHTDPKLNELADEIGVAAYGYYYTLIELYGSKYADRDENDFVNIHVRTISNMWRKRTDSCDKVMTKLQLSGLLVFTKLQLSSTKTKNTYSLSIPNFAKYYGSYKKKTPPTPSNKRKENKIKVNKSINSESAFTPDDLTQLWNTMLTPYGFDHCRGIGTGKFLSDFLEARQWLKTVLGRVI